MAKNDNDTAWKRLREREEEEEERQEEKRQKESPGSKAAPGDLLGDGIHRADILMGQLSHLYQMFAAGMERMPPLERRKQLDDLMNTLLQMPKATPAANFRYNSLRSSYSTHCERWDKLLKDIESGKIKRPLVPRK